MERTPEVQSLDNILQIDYDGLMKPASAGSEPLVTSTGESAAFPARTTKSEDGQYSDKCVDSSTDFSTSHVIFFPPIKTEHWEQDEKCDALLHPCFDVKNEPSTSLEFENSYERGEEGGRESKEIFSPEKFETYSSNNFMAPLTRIKLEVDEGNDSCYDLPCMNSKMKDELPLQLYESENKCELIDRAIDSENFIPHPSANARKTSSEIRHENIQDDASNEQQGTSQGTKKSGKNAMKRKLSAPFIKGSKFPRKNINRLAPKANGGKPYICSHCSATFALGKTLQNHLRRHTSEKPFNCSHCSASFARKDHLNEHIRKHTGEKPFSCIHCSTSFALKGTLGRHMLTHTGEKPFSCSHCPASFARKCDLKVHMLTHTAEKRFSCNQCSASFGLKHALNTHTRTHTGEKPFRCSHCPASFARKKTLNNHIRTHTGEKPFSCSHCSASFARKSYLINHLRCHTGEKPFSCSHCSACFIQKYHLTKHIRVHTGEKPYCCSRCSASFARKEYLKTHLRTHTEE